jgi:predicted RNA-binding protein YlxR (DUF448 family)
LAKTERADGVSQPERTCIVTRAKGSPDAMIRFVLGPGATVVPDIRRKLPGRGVYVTASADRVAEAVKAKAFARSFKARVEASPALALEIDALLMEDCLQALSIANKAGAVVTGFGKVEEAIAKGGIAGLIHASDGSAEGKHKLGQELRRRCGDQNATPRIELFASSQLDLALGRTNVIHAALIAGRASEAFLAKCRKLALYRCGPYRVGTVEPAA